MARDLALPDVATDDESFADAVRMLRDHLLGAVDVDLTISIDGQAYAIAWADRRAVATPEVMFAMTAGMRVLERRGTSPAQVVSTGEEQITIMIDGERLVFHLVEVGDGGERHLRLPRQRLIE
ncbi:MAG TPA: hypothetical protein VFK86_15400 [Bauldia sp.]|nr:hypothetical protein [Bauldia sp.]